MQIIQFYFGSIVARFQVAVSALNLAIKIAFVIFSHCVFPVGLAFSPPEVLVRQVSKAGLPLAVQWLRLCFHCRGYGFNPWLGDPMPSDVAGKKKLKKICLRMQL